MGFLLVSNSLSDRGDSVALFELAKALRKLGIGSSLCYEGGNTENSPARIAEIISQGFRVVDCHDRLDVAAEAKRANASHVVVFSDGTPKGIFYARSGESHRINECTHITWVVFRKFEPHGDYYLFVSRWLYVSQLPSVIRWWVKRAFSLRQVAKISYAPHFFEVGEGDRNQFRSDHRIPLSAKVVGRIGGESQFDDPAARDAVRELLSTRPDIWFVFASTEHFVHHERAIFLKRLSRRELWSFYRACDVLINGRRMGESFGLGVFEALRMGKPIIGPHRKRNPRMDKNHVATLRFQNLLYRDQHDLVRKISQHLSRRVTSRSLQRRASQSDPAFGVRRFLREVNYQIPKP